MVMDSVAYHSWGKFGSSPFLYMAWIICKKHIAVYCRLDESCVALIEAESARCALDKLEMAMGHMRNPWYCTLILMPSYLVYCTLIPKHIRSIHISIWGFP